MDIIPLQQDGFFTTNWNPATWNEVKDHTDEIDNVFDRVESALKNGEAPLIGDWFKLHAKYYKWVDSVGLVTSDIKGNLLFNYRRGIPFPIIGVKNPDVPVAIVSESVKEKKPRKPRQKKIIPNVIPEVDISELVSPDIKENPLKEIKDSLVINGIQEGVVREEQRKTKTRVPRKKPCKGEDSKVPL